MSAHLCALDRAPKIGFGRYIISVTTPFEKHDLAGLRADSPQVVRHRVAKFDALYESLGWRMFLRIDRVYLNRKARAELGWRPQYDFARVLGQIEVGEAIGSELARQIGIKGYHSEVFAEGPYPVE